MKPGRIRRRQSRGVEIRRLGRLEELIDVKQPSEGSVRVGELPGRDVPALNQSLERSSLAADLTRHGRFEIVEAGNRNGAKSTPGWSQLGRF
jgi:hypothetical protein